MNRIHMMVTEGERVTDISADVDLELTPNEDGSLTHVGDLLNEVVLGPCRNQAATLAPGKYNIRMLVIVSSMSDEVSKPND